MALSKLTDIRKSLSVEVEDLQVNGIGTFSGNVSIGGTLTYEDVTNIDSVGLITARSGIHVGAGVSAVGVGTFGSLDIGGDIDVDGHTNLDNVSIAGVSTLGGSIQNSVKILHNSGYGLRVERGGKYIDFNGDWGASGSTALNAGSSGMRFYYGNSSDGIQFNTGSGADKVRITSDGKVGINTITPAALMHVSNSYAAPTGGFGGSVFSLISNNESTSDSCGLSINAGNAGVSFVQFGDTDDANVGTIEYHHSDNSMVFDTNASERLRIGSNGLLTVTTTGQSSGIRLIDSSTSSGTPNFEIIGKRSDGNVNTAFSSNIFLGSNRTDQKVANNKILGTVNFGGNHTDGTEGNISYAAAIAGRASGDFNSKSDIPTDLIFTTGTSGTDRDGESAGQSNVGTERVRIHSTGYITKPYQVAFFAHSTIGNHDLSAGDKFQFNVLTSYGVVGVDSTHHTFGGTAVFNTSTNTFTAPVAGLYSFTVGVYFRRTGDNITHIVPRVNNVQLTNGNNDIFFFGSNDITDGNQLCGTLYLQLDASDELTIHRRTGQTGTTRFYGPHSHFCGHLIG